MKIVKDEELKKYNDNDYVWYGCYGSNINYDRFMLYIKGDNSGIYSSSEGCEDKSEPLESKKYIYNCPIYFVGESKRWTGGMAFLDYMNDGKSYGRIYKIKMSQFKSVLKQEGKLYDAIVLAGYEDNLPVLTFTSSKKLDEILNEPSDRYIDVIKKGLISCGYDFSEEEYKKYFKNGERC